MLHPNDLCSSLKPYMNCAHHYCKYHRRHPMRGVHGLYRCRKIVKAIDDYIYLFIDLLFIYVCFWTSQTNKAWLWHWLLDKGCLNVSKCPAPKKKKKKKHSIILSQWINKHHWCIFVVCLSRCNKYFKTW